MVNKKTSSRTIEDDPTSQTSKTRFDKPKQEEDTAGIRNVRIKHKKVRSFCGSSKHGACIRLHKQGIQRLNH